MNSPSFLYHFSHFDTSSIFLCLLYIYVKFLHCCVICLSFNSSRAAVSGGKKNLWEVWGDRAALTVRCVSSALKPVLLSTLETEMFWGVKSQTSCKQIWTLNLMKSCIYLRALKPRLTVYFWIGAVTMGWIIYLFEKAVLLIILLPSVVEKVRGLSWIIAWMLYLTLCFHT